VFVGVVEVVLCDTVTFSLDFEPGLEDDIGEGCFDVFVFFLEPKVGVLGR